MRGNWIRLWLLPLLLAAGLGCVRLQRRPAWHCLHVVGAACGDSGIAGLSAKTALRQGSNAYAGARRGRRGRAGRLDPRSRAGGCWRRRRWRAATAPLMGGLLGAGARRHDRRHHQPDAGRRHRRRHDRRWWAAPSPAPSPAATTAPTRLWRPRHRGHGAARRRPAGHGGAARRRRHSAGRPGPDRAEPPGRRAGRARQPRAPD